MGSGDGRGAEAPSAMSGIEADLIIQLGKPIDGDVLQSRQAFCPVVSEDWALYVFFKQVNKSLALFAAWFMLVHDAILGAALLNLVFGSVLLSGADYLTVFEPNQLHALGLLFLDGFNYGFQIGLIFFSFHLGILGYLVYKSGYIPRILSVLLIVASFGYLIKSIGILLPNYPEIIEQVLIAPNLIGELAIIVWLVFKGGKGSTAR